MFRQMLTVFFHDHSFSRPFIDDTGSILYPICEFIPPSVLKQLFMVLVRESRAENAVTVRSIIFSKKKLKKHIMFFLFILIIEVKVFSEI